MHLSEDDLILHYYGEARASEVGAATHLASCDDCRQAFEHLRRVMETIDAAPVPEPAVGFERDVWARLQPRLERKSSPAYFSRGGLREKYAGLNFRSLVFAGSLASLVIALIVWQFNLPFTRTIDDPRPAADAESHRERVLLTAVSHHIDQSQMVLVELANAEPAEGNLDVTRERTSADDLVSAGRLYRETARQTGDLQLASLLEELELVLVEIARGPETLSAEELRDLRAQIDQQELIFKLRVLGADVAARQKSAQPAQGISKRTL